VTDPAKQVVPERGQIAIDTKVIERRARRLIAFHKPRRTVTSRRDPEGRPTVFDVLGDAGDGLIAVGRLDYASTGLLLFTNDTQLANRLTDPSTGLLRRYVVTVRGLLTDEQAHAIETGVDTKGARGVERLSAARVEIRKRSRGSLNSSVLPLLNSPITQLQNIPPVHPEPPLGFSPSFTDDRDLFPESSRVVRLPEVHQLVDDDVVGDGRRHLDEAPVECDRAAR
jgi:pseudouridine synthase